MADTPPPAQRAWRAACPNCGAPVDFHSAASASAVCGYCRSTLLREGEALRRIGESAELFDDHSPLQLGATGRHLGAAFTLVGRLQIGYARGSWNEWHALFANGRSGWLSEDNGAYVLAFDAPPPGPPPDPATLKVGAELRLGPGPDAVWSVASLQTAMLRAAEGELPRPPRPGSEFTVADLRNARDEVATLDYSDPAAAVWSVGRSVRLAELQLSGLREGEAVKTMAGRSLACPSCGASLEPKLDSTRSIVCGQCHAVVDLAGGALGEAGQALAAGLTHYAQETGARAGMEPLLPLGRTGRLALDLAAPPGGGEPLPWQVVGYQERCDLPAPGSDDEQTFWREYLLYHRREGFAFLIDAEDGWSWVRPLTGAPQVSGSSAAWAGDRYRQRWSYDAQTTYVLGEFYWQVRRGERVQVTDYDGQGAARHKRLSRERSQATGDNEVTWSAGATLEASSVADAFGIPPSQRAALQRDAAPTSLSKLGTGASSASALGTPWIQRVLIYVVLALIVLALLGWCSSSSECDTVAQTFGSQSAEYQQCLRQQGSNSSGIHSSGGSWGGYSSGGGGHK
ncbi:MAG TPA: DUF4178 domain-containing protein [Burkholderiaceae bacterium]|nr:DUF4178 domain-containing protein [Burkholderiaceae bacterium]HMX12002.1 DUF4178 domain-containing protein [Burkholderiaceae bacterium]HNB45605.1 DUF4178 domain-containing protein [Burkholderiaceae bacterium]HNG81820.1 DUF4178 domain-containing protein [Burkholderiaceae bacterium]